MFGKFVLIALGATYLADFARHWLAVRAHPFAVDLRRVHFSHLCHLSLGAFYTLSGVVGH